MTAASTVVQPATSGMTSAANPCRLNAIRGGLDAKIEDQIVHGDRRECPDVTGDPLSGWPD
jgi:hypothetical protein